jgi:uncharacterized membrane-anchored protein
MNNSIAIESASKSLVKSIKQLEDEFDLTSCQVSKSPRDNFTFTVEQLKEFVAEVVNKAYMVGARHGATAAVDAMIAKKIKYENGTVFFMNSHEPLILKERTISGPTNYTKESVTYTVGQVRITYKHMGFSD